MSEAIAVFLGPSLPVAQAHTLLDAQYHPPARMGDIYRVLGDVCAIVLIDGVFHSVPAIWHREILDALGEGVRVYGAASMGALRAAELHSHGMVGVGKVFGWYRDGVIDSDDEVTLLHGPEEAGYVALSEPLVNIRATLDSAVADGCLLPDQATTLLAHARQTHYTRRSFADLLHCPALRSWPPEVARRLTDYLRTQRSDIKRADAIAALQACADKVAPAVAPKLPPSYGAAWQAERAQHSTFHTAAGSVGGADMLQAVASSPQLAAAHMPGIAERSFACAWGAARGMTGVGGALLDPADRASFQAWRSEYVVRWQREHRIVPDQGWLRANGISAAIYRAALDERALADWLIARFAEGSGRRMVALWASAQGVHTPDGAADEQALSEWVLMHGPGFFGLRWMPDMALLRELQISGAAARLVLERNVTSIMKP